METQTTVTATQTASASTPVVGIVGLGYVGLPIAVLAAQKGVTAIGYDVSEKALAKLSSGKSTVDDISDAELQQALEGGLMTIGNDPQALANATSILICVPTPVGEDHQPDLSYVESATRSVAEQLKPGQLIILESTVNPGVSDGVVIPLLESISGFEAGKDFYFAYCPERVDPGNPNWDTNNIPRVVGGYDAASLKQAVALYQAILDAPIKEMYSLKEAESVKILENTFRDINIAFVNELARSFHVLGIDIKHVIEGAATKPYGFMPFYPSCGIGGHCIPVDPYYLIEYAKRAGFEHEFLKLAREINNDMPTFTVGLVTTQLAATGKTLSGAKVALLGLSYKPNISDLRESPALVIQSKLTAAGATVVSYDPFVAESDSVKTLDEALADADIVVVATHHTEFIENLTPQRLQTHGITAVVDGRNCLDKEALIEAGISYVGIGR